MHGGLRVAGGSVHTGVLLWLLSGWRQMPRSVQQKADKLTHFTCSWCYCSCTKSFLWAFTLLFVHLCPFEVVFPNRLLTQPILIKQIISSSWTKRFLKRAFICRSCMNWPNQLHGLVYSTFLLSASLIHSVTHIHTSLSKLINACVH